MFKWKTSKNNTVYLTKVGITNCFLIKSNGINILIDTGQKRKSNVLKSHVNRLLDGDKLNYLILTHAHYDHAENAHLIKKEFGPKIIIHESESAFLANGFTKLPKGTHVIPNLITYLGNKFASKIGKYEPVKADIIIQDHYELEETDDIKIIHTPGHTIGSVSIIIDKEIAIVGDTLFGIFPGKILPPFADNKEQLFKSWEKLIKTDSKIYLPAHGKAITRNLFEKLI